MKKDLSLRKFLRDLFKTQRLAVLATLDGRQPYGNLVAFTTTHDLKYLLFATSRATRKYSNISRNPRAAMVIDNRLNREADFRKATAVTAVGTVREIEEKEKPRYQRLYLLKHPYLKEFLLSPNCALLRMEVETYYMVSQFQEVTTLELKKKSKK